jgi:hypothetical protein
MTIAICMMAKSAKKSRRNEHKAQRCTKNVGIIIYFDLIRFSWSIAFGFK